MAKSMTEDAVRDLAREALGLVDSEIARAGVGQLTTFNQLGFPGVADKPDGWYLPNNKNEVAVVLETKATRITLGQAQVDEVLKNVRIMQTQYKKVVGILYNGEDIRVFKGEEEVKTPTKLQSVSYYLSLYTVDSIDKERIYELTAKINNGLHFEFGIKNLYHRMIFTACALVAERYGAGLRRLKNMGYATFHTAIHSTLSKSLEDSRKQNAKIDILLEEYSDIKMNTTDNQQAINDFIDWIVEISECVNSNEWRGEDVMGIVKPVVLHTRQVVESPEGIPYVVRTKFNNGIKCRVQPVTGVTPSPAGVISWGAENATFFYQPEPFLSGRDIYYIDTREFNPLVCMFLASCLQTVVHKYPYNFGLFPDLLKEEKIKLPVIADGTPDWIYMGEYMRMRMESAKTDLVNMQSAL